MLGKDDRHHVAQRLSRLRRRFDEWRRTRSLGTRIPQALWHEAVQLATIVGVHRTAACLRLDYYSLQQRVQQPADPPQPEETVAPSPRPVPSRSANSRSASSVGRNSRPPGPVEARDTPGPLAFVELTSPGRVAARPSLIEFQTGRGVCLRVHLSGGDLADILTLARGLCALGQSAPPAAGGLEP